jgi:hypothetical protein
VKIEQLRSLAETIEQASELLTRYGDKFTAPRLLKLSVRLRQGDESAVLSALSESTGGMGSLNDRVFCRENGDLIDVNDIGLANGQLRRLVHDIEVAARLAAATCGLRTVR